MIIRQRLIEILMLALLTLGGCGFHLRGESPLLGTMSRLSVEGLPLSPIRQALISRLEKSGVVVSPDASVVISLLDENSEKRVSAYSSRAKTAAFELRRAVTVRVTLRNDPKHPLVGDTEFLTRRQLLFRQDQVLGKMEEEGRLLGEMEKELVERIVRKLETLTPAPQAIAGDALQP
jgi:LPS-assembly lipoprotein